jgi:branched-chain amino acid transport system substrate-binding protein
VNVSRCAGSGALGRAVSSVIVVGVAAIAIAGCGGSDDGSATQGGTASKDAPTKIGFILPKTGPLAAIGGAFDKGVQAAIEYWNADSSHRKIEVESCDSQSTGPGALGCYQRLKGSVDAFAGPSFFLELASVKEQGSAGDVPMMSAVPVAEPAAGSALFQNLPTVATATTTGVQYLKDHGATRLAVLTSNDPPGKASREAAKAAGVQVVADEVFDPTAQSIAPQAENIARAKPDALMAWTAGPQVITALRGLSSAGVKVPIMLNYSSMSIPLLQQAGAAAGDNLNFLGTAAFVPDSITDAAYQKRVQDYSAVYAKKFEGASPDFNGLIIADTLLILAEAADKGGPDKIKDTLESGTEFPGLVFDTYSFTKDRHVGQESGDGFTILKWSKAGSPSWSVAPK